MPTFITILLIKDIKVRHAFQLLILPFIYVFISIQTVCAASTVKACSTEGAPLEDSDQIIQEISNGEAVFKKSNLEFFRQEEIYTMELYALGQADPSITLPPYSICRRYELINTSDEVIQALRWPDIKLPLYTKVKPKQRIRTTRKSIHNSKQLGKLPTELYIFENSSVTDQTVFPIKQVLDAGITNNNAHYQIHSLNSDLYLESSHTPLPEGLVLDATQALYSPKDRFEYPILITSLLTDDFSFVAQSQATAFPDDEYVDSSSLIKIESSVLSDFAITAPGIVTLNSADFSEVNNVNDRIQHYAKLFLHKNSGVVSLANSQDFDFGYQLPEDVAQPVLFVVEQPVKIVTSDWAVCIFAQVYSPIPISISPTLYC